MSYRRRAYILQAFSQEQLIHPYDQYEDRSLRMSLHDTFSARETHCHIPMHPVHPSFCGHYPPTFAKNDLSQVVHAFAGSTIKGTLSGIFARTKAFSCELEIPVEVRYDTGRASSPFWGVREENTITASSKQKQLCLPSC